MSFSSRVKEELARQESKGRHCCIAEFAAIFMLCGKIRKGGCKKYYLQIDTENLTVAQKSYILLRKTFRVQIEVAVHNHNIRSSGVSFSLIVKRHQDVILILKALKIMNEDGNLWGDFHKIRQRLVQNTCCKRAYLRGSFLVAGSVTNQIGRAHV